MNSKKKGMTLAAKQKAAGWIFLAPASIMIAIMSFYPMIRAFIISLQTGAGANMRFADPIFSNYKRILADKVFQQSIGNTFLYLIIQVPIMLILAILLAQLLNNKDLKFKGFFLDVSIQSQVLNLLRQLQESMGMAYIFISHNLSVIKHISDRVMVMYLGHVVELADKKELFANPSHPYTQALLSAIPVPERHSKRKKIILQGDLPSPANPPSGCIFHTRCFMAQEICSTQKPELRDIGGGHLCACHFCNGACAQNGTTEEK